jgi:hypothetical protein
VSRGSCILDCGSRRFYVLADSAFGNANDPRTVYSAILCRRNWCLTFPPPDNVLLFSILYSLYFRGVYSWMGCFLTCASWAILVYVDVRPSPLPKPRPWKKGNWSRCIPLDGLGHGWRRRKRQSHWYHNPGQASRTSFEPPSQRDLTSTRIFRFSYFFPFFLLEANERVRQSENDEQNLLGTWFNCGIMIVA